MCNNHHSFARRTIHNSMLDGIFFFGVYTMYEKLHLFSHSLSLFLSLFLLLTCSVDAPLLHSYDCFFLFYFLFIPKWLKIESNDVKKKEIEKVFHFTILPERTILTFRQENFRSHRKWPRLKGNFVTFITHTHTHRIHTFMPVLKPMFNSTFARENLTTIYDVLDGK